MTASTYRAVQATAPGQLELVELPIQEPPAGHVRIRVEACGVCHSDAATVEGVMPVEYPRVPGHELVGRIEALGEGVSGWELGQRVGVGFLGGHCNVCAFCRRGDFVNCTNQGWTGVHSDGGYAEVMIAKQTALAAIPEDLESVEAAPLLCAGLTTFEGLRDSGVRPGELVAVLGVGGLGHLGIQYARSMGLRVAAIARGEEKRALAEQLGAHHYIDSSATDPAVALQELGGAALVLATAANGDAMSATLGGLRPRPPDRAGRAQRSAAGRRAAADLRGARDRRQPHRQRPGRPGHARLQRASGRAGDGHDVPTGRRRRGVWRHARREGAVPERARDVSVPGLRT